jgi:REP element-mobilizing transposase RayT
MGRLMIESLVNFVTTTSYGSWLPGDARGYIQRGELLPASPALEQHAHSLLKHKPVLFTHDERDGLERALLAACEEFGYHLFDLSIESWHLHWIARHDDDARFMIGRLKNRMRQRLNHGRIWTKGYWHRELRTEEELLIARPYIRRHPGCRIIDGNPPRNEQSPGGAGG